MSNGTTMEKPISSKQDNQCVPYDTRSKKRLRQFLKGFMAIASLPMMLIAAHFVPWEQLPTVCTFYWLTGLPCPICGITRAVVAITRFDFSSAAKLNPLAFVVLPFAVVLWLVACYESVTESHAGIADWARTRLGVLAVVGLCVVITFGAVRILFILH